MTARLAVTIQYGSGSVQGTTFPSYLYGSEVSVTAPAGGTVAVSVSTPYVEDISGRITGINQAGLEVQLSSSSTWRRSSRGSALATRSR